MKKKHRFIEKRNLARSMIGHNLRSMIPQTLKEVDLSLEDQVNQLRRQIHQPTKLARELGLHKDTVKRFAEGKTILPKASTLNRIAFAQGKTLRFTDV